ncbi:MAG: hypothetical protein ACI8TQ_002843 [Planctomycetota bacterium]|jgi:hypothetical protein
MPATATQAPTVRINGNGGDVFIIRPTGRVTIINGCDPDDVEELVEKGRSLLKGDPATQIVRAEGDVEIDGDVNDVVVVEGEAVIINANDDDDDDEDDD